MASVKVGDHVRFVPDDEKQAVIGRVYKVSEKGTVRASFFKNVSIPKSASNKLEFNYLGGDARVGDSVIQVVETQFLTKGNYRKVRV